MEKTLKIIIEGTQDTYAYYKEDLREFNADWDKVEKKWIINANDLYNMSYARGRSIGKWYILIIVNNKEWEEFLSLKNKEQQELAKEIEEKEILEEQVKKEESKKIIDELVLSYGEDKVLICVKDVLAGRPESGIKKIFTGELSLNEEQIKKIKFYLEC